MCKNLTTRQELLPTYMKMTQEQEAAQTTTPAMPSMPPTMPSMPAMSNMAVPPVPAPSPANQSLSASQGMGVFVHPGLNRNHRIANHSPAATVTEPVQPFHPVAPVSQPAPASVPVSQPVSQPAPQPAPAPARGFGLASKGPRVVAGVSRANSKIQKYTPPASQPAPAPLPQPQPQPSQPCQPTPQPLPQPSQPSQPSQPVEPNTMSSYFHAPTETAPKPLIKPKPAKP